MRERFQGYTGKLAESEVLGSPEKIPNPEEYIPFKQALEIVRGLQLSEPSDPESRFPNEVHATLADILQLEDYRQVEYYTALGSPLDRFHGIDAFFEIETGRGRVTITLDITQNPHKKDYKADIVIQWPREGLDVREPEDQRIWREKVKELAEEIIEVLRRKAGDKIAILSEEEIDRIRNIHRMENYQRLPKKSATNG